MALNKFCPVAQGEYYNNKAQPKSQPFFTCFFTFLYIFYGVVTHEFHFYNIMGYIRISNARYTPFLYCLIRIYLS